MKFVGRVFGLLGIVGVFSIYNFSAMAYKDCNVKPAQGYYCKDRGSHKECPKGCWCEGSKHHVNGIDVTLKCQWRNWTAVESSILSAAGIHLCPLETPDSEKRGGKPERCKAPKDCALFPSEGHYCEREGFRKPCPEGCYCDGNIKLAVGAVDDHRYWRMVTSRCKDHKTYADTEINAEEYLALRGIHYCPYGFTQSYKKAETIEDCYEYYNGRPIYYKKHTCDAGNYLPKQDDICQECPADYYCPGITEAVYPSATINQGIRPCPGAAKGSSTCNNSLAYSGTLDRIVNSNLDPHLLVVTGGSQGGSGEAPESYTVTYQCGDGATGTPPTQQTVAKDTAVTISANVGTCVKSDYSFSNEWKKGTEPFVAGAEHVFNEDVTLVAQWSWNDSETFDITYNCGDGTGNPGPQNVANGGSVTIRSNTECQRDGYSFTQWISGNDYFVAGDTISSWSYGDKSLTPDWQNGTGGGSVVTGTYIPVSAGYYIPAGETEPVSCVNNSNIGVTQFCPGGNWLTEQATPQGVFSCLPNGIANADRKSCRVTLDALDLTDGILDEGYCWLFDDVDEYRACVFYGATDAAQ